MLIVADGVIGNNVISAGNVIAYNSKGIVSGTNSVRNNFSGNSIHDNAGLGIDLDDDGVTPNDAGDGDTGANELVNFPVLETVDRNPDGTIFVTGTYDGSLPSSFYQLDFYVNESCDSSGFGEGATWLGSTSNLADGSGDFSFNTDNALTGHVAGFSAITATATDTFGDTSEFSQCLTGPNDPATMLAVDTTAGGTVGDCSSLDLPADCSLRDAIAVANATPVTIPVTIGFAIPGLAAVPDLTFGGSALDHARRRARRHDPARLCGCAGRPGRRLRSASRQRLRPARHGRPGRQHDPGALDHRLRRFRCLPRRAAVARRGQLHRPRAGRDSPPATAAAPSTPGSSSTRTATASAERPRPRAT